MKKVLLFTFALFATSSLFAQFNPVKWSYEAKWVAEGEYDLIFTAHISDGWYVYSQNLESDDGPIPTSFTWGSLDGVELIGDTKEDGPTHDGYDEIFEMNVVKYSGKPTFTQRVRIGDYASVTGYVEYMTCDNDRCLPPTEIDFQFNFE